MHHPTDRITHTTAFVTPVVEHWLEWEIIQWVHHEGSIWQPITPWANAHNGWRWAADAHCGPCVCVWCMKSGWPSPLHRAISTCTAADVWHGISNTEECRALGLQSAHTWGKVEKKNVQIFLLRNEFRALIFIFWFVCVCCDIQLMISCWMTMRTNEIWENDWHAHVHWRFRQWHMALFLF